MRWEKSHGDQLYIIEIHMAYKQFEVKYNLNDICIVPEPISSISSRAECDTRENGKLPIFIAPMGSVINEQNFELFDNQFNTILPRTVKYSIRETYLKNGSWVALGLKEAQSLYEEYTTNLPNYIPHICIDQANGHMEKLISLCANFKQLLGSSIVIMVGNIANPTTCKYFYGLVDYIRIGIGSGNVCTTTVQTGIHYPMASLIRECRDEIQDCIDTFEGTNEAIRDNVRRPKIVVDGGFKDIAQIIKALALGADYCMIGKIPAQFKEACGEDIGGLRVYYGMSTQEAQRLIHAASKFSDEEQTLKNSEGLVDFVEINTTMDEWVDKFESALRSSMSYTNSRKLKDFIGECRIIVKK